MKNSTTAIISAAAIDGIQARLVTVEVTVTDGDPLFTVSGIGDLAIRETRQRVSCAIENAGYALPMRRISVAIDAGGLQLAGADLAVALGTLIASGQIPVGQTDQVVVAGDLALSGSVRSIRGGAFPVAEATEAAGKHVLIVPRPEIPEAAAGAGEIALRGVSGLEEAADALQQHDRDDRASVPAPRPLRRASVPSMDDVDGQEDVKAALTAAARTGRSVLLIGAPGTGKRMLARRVPGLLDPMTDAEAREVTRIHSAVGLLEGALANARPFRAPHHGTSVAGLIGGGSHARPGEATLAHRGVLFLDQIQEFKRDAIDALRIVLADRESVCVGRNRARTFPADVLLIGSMTACACGLHGTPHCRCSTVDIERYRDRTARIRDLFDVHLRVERQVGRAVQV